MKIVRKFVLTFSNSGANVTVRGFSQESYEYMLRFAYVNVAKAIWEHAQIWYAQSKMLAWDSDGGHEEIVQSIDVHSDKDHKRPLARLEDGRWNWVDVSGNRHKEPKDGRFARQARQDS